MRPIAISSAAGIAEHDGVAVRRASTPKPPWHRNLLLALCFPKFGEPRQSSIPFGKIEIENDALRMRVSFEAGGSGRFTRPTERMTGAFRQNATHRRERLRLGLTRTPLYSWRSRAAASTESLKMNRLLSSD
jgi:hypothetical protein